MKKTSDKRPQSDTPLLVEQTAIFHEPVQINGLSASTVPVAEGDLHAIKETLYLLSIPGMRESILEGMQTPVEQCSSELTW